MKMGRVEKIVWTLILVVALALFLKKVSPSISEDGALDIDWWPGVDFSFSVYADHVRADRFDDEEQTELVIPDRIWFKPVTEIRTGFCLISFPSLEKVEIGKYVERIGRDAFGSVRTLREVTGGENVKYIDESAFSMCEELEYVEFGENLEYIGRQAFWCCGFESLATSDELEHVGNSAFEDSSLKEIHIPDTLSDIGSMAFLNTPWLEKQPADAEGFAIVGDGVLTRYDGTDSVIRIPEGVKNITYLYDNTYSDVEIYVPDTVTTIGAKLFENVEHMITFYIPASVTEIARWFDKNMDELIPTETNYRNLHIITTENSVAHQYALDRGISFEIVEELPEY